MPFEPYPSALQAIFAAPTATVSTSQVMLGAVGATPSATITPLVTGRIFVMFSGSIANSTNGDGSQVQISFGTGTAPIAGAAVTGTQIGQIQTWTSLTSLLKAPFMVQAIITGLAVPSVTLLHGTGTPVPVWLDLAFNAVSGGTTTITVMNLLAFEF